MKTRKNFGSQSRLEALESRRLLAADAGAIALDAAEIRMLVASDTSGDGKLSPFDALKVINFLSKEGVDVPATHSPEAALVDVTGTNGVTPFDALAIINRLGTEATEGIVDINVERLVNSVVRNSDGTAICLAESDQAALQTLYETVTEQRVEIGVTAEEVSDLIDATVGLADETILDPSAEAIANLESLFESVSADGEISSADVAELRAATDALLQTTGATADSIDLCLDGLETISLRGISPEALESIYNESVALLTNWTVIGTPPPSELAQIVSNLADQFLSGNANPQEVINTIQEAADPEGTLNLTQPSNISLLGLIAAFQLGASDGELSAEDRSSIGNALGNVFGSMGMPTADANALIASIDEVLANLPLS